MMTKDDVKRLQHAAASQQAGNNILGTIGLKGGFACTTSGGVLGASVGPFVIVPGSAFGAPAGVYRAYPQAFGQPAGNPQSGASTPTFVPYSGQQGQIVSIDYANVTGFTPRNPGSAETCAALVTGYNIDTANNQWYMTIQISTLAGAIENTPPSNFVVGIEMAVSFSKMANPL